MQELEVVVEFSTLVNSPVTNLWCDDIKLYIVYGTYSESSQGKSIVRHNGWETQYLWGRVALQMERDSPFQKKSF